MWVAPRRPSIRHWQNFVRENPDYPVMGITPDLSDFDSITAEFNKVKEAFGSIDILGNNAGVSARESIYEYDPEAFKKTMELNVNAAFLCCRCRCSDHEGTRGRGSLLILPLW